MKRRKFIQQFKSSGVLLSISPLFGFDSATKCDQEALSLNPENNLPQSEIEVANLSFEQKSEFLELLNNQLTKKEKELTDRIEFLTAIAIQYEEKASKIRTLDEQMYSYHNVYIIVEYGIWNGSEIHGKTFKTICTSYFEASEILNENGWSVSIEDGIPFKFSSWCNLMRDLWNRVSNKNDILRISDISIRVGLEEYHQADCCKIKLA